MIEGTEEAAVSWGVPSGVAGSQWGRSLGRGAERSQTAGCAKRQDAGFAPVYEPPATERATTVATASKMSATMIARATCRAWGFMR